MSVVQGERKAITGYCLLRVQDIQARKLTKREKRFKKIQTIVLEPKLISKRLFFPQARPVPDLDHPAPRPRRPPADGLQRLVLPPLPRAGLRAPPRGGQAPGLRLLPGADVPDQAAVHWVRPPGVGALDRQVSSEKLTCQGS